jgi:O-antigen/teichoic acid export membrane protein
MAKLSALTIISMAATTMLLSIDPESLIRAIYGNGYPGVASLVRWACVAAVIYCCFLLLGIWAAAIERTSLIFRSYLVASVFTLVASYPLTLYGGLEGVVIGAALVEAIKVAMLVEPLLRWRK